MSMVLLSRAEAEENASDDEGDEESPAELEKIEGVLEGLLLLLLLLLPGLRWGMLTGGGAQGSIKLTPSVVWSRFMVGGGINAKIVVGARSSFRVAFWRWRKKRNCGGAKVPVLSSWLMGGKGFPSNPLLKKKKGGRVMKES